MEQNIINRKSQIDNKCFLQFNFKHFNMRVILNVTCEVSVFRFELNLYLTDVIARHKGEPWNWIAAEK